MSNGRNSQLKVPLIYIVDHRSSIIFAETWVATLALSFNPTEEKFDHSQKFGNSKQIQR